MLGIGHIGRGGTMTEVAVDDEHTLALDSKGGGEVHGYERLATARIERGEYEDVVTGFARGHEVDVGAEHTECLVDDVATALSDKDVGTVCVLVLLLPRQSSGIAHSEGYLTYKRYGDALKVLATTHLGVHILAQYNDYCGQQQTYGKGHKEDVHLLGSRGKEAATRSGDDAGVIGGECL